MDSAVIGLLCSAGVMGISAFLLFWLIIHDLFRVKTRVTALEDRTEIDVLKERVALLERERDVRTLRRVVDRATAFRDENDGRPN